MPSLLQVRNSNVEFAGASGAIAAVRELREKSSLLMLFNSRDLAAVVWHVSQHIGVMYAGVLVDTGAAADVFRNPARLYTRGLLNSVPTLRTSRSKPLQTTEDMVAASAPLLSGCLFEPCCPCYVAACATELPPPVEAAPGHLARIPGIASEVR